MVQGLEFGALLNQTVFLSDNEFFSVNTCNCNYCVITTLLDHASNSRENVWQFSP